MSDTALSVTNLTKLYGGIPALDEFGIEAYPGELLCMVGPSGSGKTTALMAIAGLVDHEKGSIVLNGKDLAGVSPRDRGIAMVFQDGALYPHLTVKDNLAFPLRARGRKGDRAVDRMAKRLDIHPLLDRYPSEISGGEARRVALGRALIRKPKLFLLDEPLAGLDIPLKEKLRGLIRDLVAERGVTTICVTHDQSDAMAIGDRVAVLKAGRVVQCASPKELYEKPAHLFVAEFFGPSSMNILHGDIHVGVIKGGWGELECRSGLPDGPVAIAFRLESLKGSETEKGIRGRIKRVEFFGHERLVTFELSNGGEIRQRVDAGISTLHVGQLSSLMVSVEDIHFFHAKTGERL